MFDVLAPIALLFIGSMALAWGVSRWWARRTDRLPEVTPGAVVRLRTLDGFYRTRLVEVRPGEWVFAAPLRHDVPVPFRVGERLTVEIAIENGCILGQTVVGTRQPNPPQFTVPIPHNAKRVDRRSEVRTNRYDGFPIRANGSAAELVDLSLQGLSFRTSLTVARGDAVNLTLPEGLGDCTAWVLDVTPDRFGARAGCLVHARFSLPLDRFPV